MCVAPPASQTEDEHHPALMEMLPSTEKVYGTQEQAISRDMDRLGLWGKDVDNIPYVRVRYMLPYVQPSTPGDAFRILFRTAWADRAVREVCIIDALN